MLRVENLTKIYKLTKKQMKLENTKDPRKIAANNVSFEVKRGEIFGLLAQMGRKNNNTTLYFDFN